MILPPHQCQCYLKHTLEPEVQNELNSTSITLPQHTLEPEVLVCSVTTDNSSNMDVFGCMLREKFQYKYGNQDFEHVRCAAHVLNLAVSEGMKIVVNSIAKATKLC
ncbi:758_t:CDS:2 [Gigaspora margarita]|uniref:758_t:CDS:1 n=1 Tax=Gigaspora margarita TaxID=4874 RepID=A0ABN7UI21_GIGMA|nr:758_t:CDS:2 [Gigaspora margarita]